MFLLNDCLSLTHLRSIFFAHKKYSEKRERIYEWVMKPTSIPIGKSNFFDRLKKSACRILMVAALPNKSIYVFRWYRLTNVLILPIAVNILHVRCKRCFHKLNYEILKCSERQIFILLIVLLSHGCMMLLLKNFPDWNPISH